MKTHRFKRHRPGYYETRDSCYEIEKMDESAEVYPGNDYYGQWRVYDKVSDEKWFKHFNTYSEARNAVWQYGYDFKNTV
jgi:hypothetical protein